MIQPTLFIITLLISSLLIIAVFGRKKRSKLYNIVFLLTGNILLVASWFINPFPKDNMLILFVTFGILNLFAIRKIFGPENPSQEILNSWHDDPANWIAGVFYYNPKDKRIFPPKKIEGMGWTINFADPYSILAFLGILLLLGIFVYMSAVTSSK